MATTTLTQPYVGGGLAAAFLPAALERLPLAVFVGTGGVVASLVLAGVWRVVAGIVAVVAGAAAGALVVALGRRRVGGFTGDVLGATGMVSETVGLVAAAARW